MTAAVETMAYVGETPWHGLGKRLEAGATVEQMTEAAGLNWSVSQHPIFTVFNDQTVEVPNKSAVIREDNGKVLSVSSKAWKPLQNAELMEFFREYVEAGSAVLETAGSLHDGKVIWALANINEGFTLNGNDRVNGYILLSNSHEPGSAIRAMTTMVRVVCQNTLTLAHGRGQDHYRQNHMKDFDMLAARESIQLARENVKLHEQEAKALSDLKLSAFDTMSVLAQNFQPEMADSEDNVKILLSNPDAQNKVLGEVLRSVVMAPGALPESAWGVLNGVTHYADHVAGRSEAARMMRSTFGDLSARKLAVRKQLLEMADYQLEAA